MEMKQQNGCLCLNRFCLHFDINVHCVTEVQYNVLYRDFYAERIVVMFVFCNVTFSFIT